MAFYGCRSYPYYNFKVHVDVDRCVYHGRLGNGNGVAICKRDGSRRSHKSCAKCRALKPSLMARLKAAKSVLDWDVKEA